MLEAGTPAPDFTLPDQDGNPVTLSDLRGGTVVLYFYPKADTPGCTKEACGFRDALADYDRANVAVLGISPDPVEAVNWSKQRELIRSASVWIDRHGRPDDSYRFDVVGVLVEGDRVRVRHVPNAFALRDSA